MPHCPRCKRGVATEPFKYPDGHKGHVCKQCLEGLMYLGRNATERIAYLKGLEEEEAIQKAREKRK